MSKSIGKTTKRRYVNKKVKKDNSSENTISLTMECEEEYQGLSDQINQNTNSKDDSSQNVISNSTIDNVQWINKYNPRQVTDLVLDDITSSKLSNIIRMKSIHNMIINGTSGVGKTATIISLVKNVLGKYYNKAVYELNSYDEKGVKIIHEKLENFCKRKISVNNIDIPKIIILDDSDNMTKKTQQIVGYLMDKYDKVKFMFTCNDLSDIIESIQSRCIILQYLKLPDDKVRGRLIHIADNENVSYTKSGIDAIINVSCGDLRKAINILQLIHTAFNNVTEKYVYNLCDKPHPKIIGNIIEGCINNNIKEALCVLNKLYDDGYSSLDIALGMKSFLKSHKDMDGDIQIKYLIEVSKSCVIISKGINTKIQLDGCIASLCLLNF